MIRGFAFSKVMFNAGRVAIIGWTSRVLAMANFLLNEIGMRSAMIAFNRNVTAKDLSELDRILNVRNNHAKVLINGVPVFEPATPADFVSHLSHIFIFSEQWDMPVLCRFTEQMLDRTTDIEPAENAPMREPCEFIRDTNKYLLGPLNYHRKKKNFDKRLVRP